MRTPIQPTQKGLVSRPLTVSAVLLFLLPMTALAQRAQFRACYVPEVGAVYLIGLFGLASECLSPEHDEVSWTDGGDGSIADGAVTAAALANGAVTPSALANGAVTAAALADDAVTTAALANGAVTSVALAADAVTSVALADDAVTPAALANDAVTTAALANGAVTGEKLDLGYEIVWASRVTTATGTFHTSVDCPPGKKVLGGGGALINGPPTSPGVDITWSLPYHDGTGWITSFNREPNAVGGDHATFAVCANLN